MARSIDEIVERLMAHGWKPNPPASTIQLINIERRYGVRLPHDYREFFGISNGGGPAPPNAFRGLMRLDEVTLFNEKYSVQKNFPGLVAFANEGFLVYAFDFRDADVVVVSVGMSSSDWGDVVTDAQSFAEWLEDGMKADGRLR